MMASLTLSMSKELKNDLTQLRWINWSEISREEARKKVIFEHYLKTGTLTDDEWAFCEKRDWHPVDELPLKESFKKELEKRKKEKFIKVKSVDDLFKHIRH